MDDEYLKKVVGEARFYLKIIENEIKDLEEVVVTLQITLLEKIWNMIDKGKKD